MSSILQKKNTSFFGSLRSTKAKPRLKKTLQFSPDVQIREESDFKLPIALQIPIQDDIMQSAFDEFEQLRSALQVLFHINRDTLRKKATFAQNIAYRVLGSIDWTCADFNHIEQLFKPFIKNHSGVLTREHGKFIKLNESEVKMGIHEWAVWRVKFNNHLIETSKEPHQTAANTDIPLHFNDHKSKENIYLYMIAKWSNDYSELDFGSYVHYGIPRARIRTRFSQPDDIFESMHNLKINNNNNNNTTSPHSSGFLSASSSCNLTASAFTNESSLTNVTQNSAESLYAKISVKPQFSRCVIKDDEELDMTIKSPSVYNGK